MSNRITAILISISTILAFSSSGRSQNADIQRRAGYIYGYMNTLTANLWECADFDKQNAVAYVNAFDQYIKEVQPVANRVVMIISTEARRSGASSEDVSKALVDAKRMAAEPAAEARQRDPAGFLVMCRARLAASSRHLLDFRPLREAFPDHMRAIDEWK